MRAKSSIDAAYCMALRARTNSGMPLGSKPVKLEMVVSVIMMPAELMPKSSPRVDQAGHAVHDEAAALGGRDVEDDVPALAGGVAGPVVVARSPRGRPWCSCRWRRRRCSDRRARRRWRACRWLCRATCRSRGSPARRSARRCPRRSSLTPLRLQPVDDAVQLVAILLLDVRPEDLFGGLAEEGPVLLLVVHHLGGDGV